MAKMAIKMKGMASWAGEPMVVVEGKEILLATPTEVLWAMRKEYTPDLLPVKEMFRDGKIHYAIWRKNGKAHYTIRGWVDSLVNRRTYLSVHRTTTKLLEETFLELYPPWGEFVPPTFQPWSPGMVKSGPRIPAVEYCLTSVFDSHVLPGKDGWAAFQRLISRALRNLEKETRVKRLREIWQGVQEQKEQDGKKAVNPVNPNFAKWYETVMSTGGGGIFYPPAEVEEG